MKSTLRLNSGLGAIPKDERTDIIINKYPSIVSKLPSSLGMIPLDMQGLAMDIVDDINQQPQPQRFIIKNIGWILVVLGIIIAIACMKYIIS